MKRRLSSIVAIMLVMCLSLTACTNPFKKGDKNEEPAPEVTENQADGWVEIIGSGPYDMGQVVGVDEVVKVKDDVAGNVTQIGFISGGLLDALPTDEDGEHSVTVAVEFVGGEVWQGEFTYTVVKKDALSMLPTQLKDNLINKDWKMDEITTANELDKAAISHYLQFPIYPIDGGMATYSSSDVDWTVYALTRDEEKSYAEQGMSPLRDNIGISVMRSFIDMFAGMADEDSSIEQTYWLLDILAEYMPVSTKVTGISMYRADGTPVDVKVATYNIMGEPDTETPQVFYVDYSDTCRLIFTYSKIKMVVTQPSDDKEEESEEMPEFTSKEEMKKWVDEQLNDPATREELLKDYTVMWSYDEQMAAMQDLVNNVILGDYSELVGDGSAGDGTVADTGFEVTPPEDEEELQGTIATAKTTYAQKYPDIYKWPADPNGDEYRRWVYVIDEDTSFTSSIWLGKEQRYFNSEEDIVGEGTGTSGASTSKPSSGSDQANLVSTTLMTRYNTYLVSNSKMTDVSIDTAKSNSSIVYLTYNDKKYYIETATANSVRTYQNQCIYSTANFKNNSFTVEENAMMDAPLGKITPYKISYQDLNEKKVTGAYMAVYNINNEYLVIYSDNIESSYDTMVELLKNLIG